MKTLPIILLALSFPVHSGAYVELGLGVPFSPETGYIPDQYGIIAAGYSQHVSGVLYADAAIIHRSLTGSDVGKCGTRERRCIGDGAVEVKIRFEF